MFCGTGSKPWLTVVQSVMPLLFRLNNRKSAHRRVKVV